MDRSKVLDYVDMAEDAFHTRNEGVFTRYMQKIREEIQDE